MPNIYLEHYGRKGMKWYQHVYGKEDPRAAYSFKTRNSKNISKSKAGRSKEKTLEQLKAEYSKDPKRMFSHADLYTSDEIRTAIDRFRLENELVKMSVDRNTYLGKLSAGKRTVEKVVSLSDKASKLTTNFKNAAPTVASMVTTTVSLLDILSKKKK